MNKLRTLIAAMTLLALCVAPAVAEAPPAEPHSQIATYPLLATPDAATQARLNTVYSKLPMHFEPNEGQTDAQVKFLSRGRGYTLFLTPTEAVLALHTAQGEISEGNQQSATICGKPSESPHPTTPSINLSQAYLSIDVALMVQLGQRVVRQLPDSHTVAVPKTRVINCSLF